MHVARNQTGGAGGTDWGGRGACGGNGGGSGQGKFSTNFSKFKANTITAGNGGASKSGGNCNACNDAGRGGGGVVVNGDTSVGGGKVGGQGYGAGGGAGYSGGGAEGGAGESGMFYIEWD